jgi:hypothetical protein
MSNVSYRIKVTTEFDGSVWYTPQSKTGFFGGWKEDYDGDGVTASYLTQEEAIAEIEEWKLIAKARAHKAETHYISVD